MTLTRSKFLQKKRFNQSGQATIEYILLLAIVILGTVVMTRQLVGGLDTGVKKLGGQLEKDLRTGRARASIYGN